MAIWAIANIVRSMSLADEPACRSADGAQQPIPDRGQRQGEFQRAPPRQEYANGKNQQVTPVIMPRETDQTNRRVDIIATTQTIRRSEKATSQMPESQPASAPSCEPVESEFLFCEIEHHESLTAFGSEPATESLAIELGTASMHPRDAEQLHGGAVVALQESVDDEVLIRHAERVVAKGKMTVVNGKIGVRISETFV